MSEQRNSPDPQIRATSQEPLPNSSLGTDCISGVAKLQAVSGELSAEHVAELEEHALSGDFAESVGIFTAATPDEVPEDVRWAAANYGGESALPAMVITHTEPDGDVKFQLRPRREAVEASLGTLPKYVSGKGDRSPELPCIRAVDDAETVLIVEGTLQARAAAQWAPEGLSVYGITGIQSWMRDGKPTDHLKVVEGKNVIIIPDADASSNLAVYDGAVRLGDACVSFGALSYRFVQLPGTGKDGLDDVLARLGVNRRTEFIAGLVKGARTKPAIKKPSAAAAALKARKQEAESSSLETICVTDQPRVVTDECVRVLLETYPDKLFSNGERLVELVDTPLSGFQMKALGESDIADLVARAANLVDDRYRAQHLSKHVLHAIERCWAKFPPLDGVSTSPVVRADWSIVTKTGYDASTRMYVKLSSDLSTLDVPNEPTDGDVRAARELLYELLESFAYQDESDRAHMIAAMLTPLVRPHLPTSPGFVFNGTQPASGKGVSANTLSYILHGTAATMAPCGLDPNGGDEEIRKQMSASARKGELVKFLDEVPELVSKTLDRMLTSVIIEDRVLGKTEMIRVVNKMVVFVLGNNVLISKDSARRFLQIRLAPSPHAEQEANYRHALPGWAISNRAQLLGALLTLIRAYGVRGEPEAPTEGSFASFEDFQRVIGGILHVAGIPGFMKGWHEQRAAADYVGDTWRKHLEWLADAFGSKPFFSSDAAKLVAEDVRDESVSLPPVDDIDWTDVRKSSAALGRAWRSKVQGGGPGIPSEGTWYGDIRIIKTGRSPKNKTEWLIERYGTGSENEVAPAPVEARPMPVITDIHSDWKTK